MFRVSLVRTENNKIPFNEFIESLSIEEQADVFAAIDKLCDFKNLKISVPEKLSKYLRNGIFELRVKHQNRISRSLYFFMKGELIIFTHGFIKKKEKTPNLEIERAEHLRDIHLKLFKD